MKAIITGGAGFIGSHLAKGLLKKGWDILVVDDLSSGYRDNVPHSAEFMKLDLSKNGVLKQLPKKNIDAIFHLASHVGQELSFEKPIHDFKVNGLVTLELLNWCKKNNINKFIFASSMNVYGNSDHEYVNEEISISPPSPYSVGKIASEYFCNIYQQLGVDCTSLRLFNVYGPNQDLNNMKQGMVSIYLNFVIRGKPIEVRGSKDRFRDFVSVHDVVDAFIKCLDDKSSGKTYNISTGKKTHVWEIINEILIATNNDLSSYPIIYSEGTLMDQFGLYGNSSLITSELGWKPNVTLKKGLQEMVKWAQKSIIKK